jgi:endonuclease YncB( thermonuclease family)
MPKNVVLKVILFSLISLTLVMYVIFPAEYYEASARCPNGYHKSPSGDCEKYVPYKGLPRCPNGSHRSPDGDCEKVNNEISSSKKTDSNDNNKKSKSGLTKTKPTLPSKTSTEGIEISGPINYVVDGDTLDVNQIRIRLSLVNTPEVGESGFYTAKNFVEKLCLGKNGEVDIDDGQRQGSFGRQIGVVYCDGVNLNSELMSKGYAVISTEFCEVSEFSGEPWAKSSCGDTSDVNNNKPPIRTDQNFSSFSAKQEKQGSLGSHTSKSNAAHTDMKQKESYQLIVYLDGAFKGNNIGDNFKIAVYDSSNKTILLAQPTIDFNDNHQKISPRKGFPIIYELGQNPEDIRVCAQQENMLNGKIILHDYCYSIKQNIQKTYWYTTFDYGQIDGFQAD